MDAIGKNLFAFFEGNHVVHVHFGMSGRWAVFDLKDAPEPTPATRLRLEHKDSAIVTHLSAMIVQLGTQELFDSKKAALGEDPLREDADPDALWPRVSKSKKVIGRLLMDQGMFPGVGNIYRAEILFKAGVHPNRLATMLTREEFDRIWMHSVDLLQRGFQSGSILTVDKDEGTRLGRPNMRRYIYNQAKCGRCQGTVVSWSMDTRTCYACPHCQPLRAEESLESETMEVRVFNSHCARESLQERLKTPEKLTVNELRSELANASIKIDGKANKKADLVRLLKAHQDAVAEKSQARNPKSAAATAPEANTEPEDLARLRVAELRERLKAAGLDTRGKKDELVARLKSNVEEMLVIKVEDKSRASKSQSKRKAAKPRPGTKHLTNVASAAEAAKEKVLAGEKRNVEHIAEDDFRAGIKTPDRKNMLKAGTSHLNMNPATEAGDAEERRLVSKSRGSKAKASPVKTKKERTAKKISTPAKAAATKRRRGEKRAVEHVAEEADVRRRSTRRRRQAQA
ncbi:Endonuclease 8-like 3 [Hondaea fermentalgiana]|uniref:Endonuclease 8-like 3 n=1 Tax=Hondaea fermentalgiana TaxID=2315210 RepID=A0A2R5G4B0_9STRA|nr:Endonuclease 8-like 3 [Hondaea fermentalgiana]|eukprot:GBG25856.1 Endonuclease 8-like 3 [Hondaea fermentalgiana]